MQPATFYRFDATMDATVNATVNLSVDLAAADRVLKSNSRRNYKSNFADAKVQPDELEVGQKLHPNLA